MSVEQRTAPQRGTSALAQEVRTIAVVRALFLGDLLMSTPAWRALRRRFPKAEITLIGLPWAEAFVSHVPHLIDRFVPLPGYPGLVEQPVDPEAMAAFFAEQQAYGYDLAIQMHGDGNVTNGLVARLGARFTIGLARPGDSRLDLALPYPDDCHEVQRWLGLAGALGAPAADTSLELRLGAADHAWAEALLGLTGDTPLVGLHLGAKDPARRWPMHRFAALGDTLQRCHGVMVVLTGGPHERFLTSEAASLFQTTPLNLSGQTDLGSFAAVIGRLDLLVTNDTGAAHVAAAVGTPSVVIFGPTRPLEFAPLNRKRHLVVDAPSYGPAGGSRAAALELLPVAPVLEAALTQLALHAPGSRAASLARAVGGGEALCAG